MPRRTRIKMCGITQPEDAVFAAELGVDAIGLVFFDKSPRNISILQAQAVIKALPAFVTTVGLFYNAAEAEVQEVLSKVPLDCLQFHGKESPDFCTVFDKPFIKAIPMLSDINLSEYMQQYPDAVSFMLDAMAADQPGGTGKLFDWSLIPTQLSNKIILAGGLTPENVADAIQETQCYAVDVSSGIETVKGIKDQQRMKLFADNVNQTYTN